MAFDLNAAGGFGSGNLGDVTDPASPYINAYAAIENTGSTAYKLNLIPLSDSIYQSWNNCVGCQVLVHGVAAKSGNSATLGNFFVATITEAEYDDDTGYLAVRTDTNMYAAVSSTVSTFWQAILIPEFNNLTLKSQSIKPDPFALNNTPLGGYDSFLCPSGGLLVLKCKNTLTLAGGHIDLRDAGCPTSISSTYRPTFAHENSGSLDTDTYSGSENSIAKDKLIVNAGDGACLILAKQIVCSSGSSRIGNPSTYGVQYCRGASDSTGTPANVSNQGGSTISIVCNSWTNFAPDVIAKYRSGSGFGLARAYIAIRNAYNDFKPDEGLYALDTVSNTARLKSMCNFSGFGNGSALGANYTGNPAKCWNVYAKVTAISGKVYTISRRSAEMTELIDISVGRLVILHQSRKASAADYQDGRFWFSRITAISGNTVTIKHSLSFNLSTYNVQMIVVPEFTYLTMPTVYNNTPAYSGGTGGICAIAVKGTCNLSGGTINLEGKGTFNGVVNPMIGNYSMKCSLPLGQGNGSVLIIANNLVLNSSTRLGATHDGSPMTGFVKYGGIRSNEETGTQQGAHILLICNEIDGLNISALSTGGDGAGAGYRDTNGASGAAFIYCNTISNQNATGIVLV